MKKLIVILILLLFAAGAVVYLKFTGVTHEEIRRTVTSESGAIRTVIDDRYRKLDEKLDAVESRLGGKLGDTAGLFNDPAGYVCKLSILSRITPRLSVRSFPGSGNFESPSHRCVRIWYNRRVRSNPGWRVKRWRKTRLIN